MKKKIQKKIQVNKKLKNLSVKKTYYNLKVLQIKKKKKTKLTSLKSKVKKTYITLNRK